MKKTIKILLFILVICLTIFLGWYLSKDIPNKEDNKSNSINNNSNQQVENTNDDSNYEKTNNQNNSQNIKYLGYWYESKEHLKDNNPSSINIKTFNDKEMIFDLFISRIANFDDVKVNLNDYTFEATSDNAVTKDNNQTKITGYVSFDNGEVLVLIKDSNIKGIEPNTNYRFTYNNK